MINQVVLMGRLTAAPEMKSTQSGIDVCSFSVAVERDYKTADGQKQTDFINCTAWRQTAAFIDRYFGKGDMIAIVGELQTRKYKDKNGNDRTAVEVMVNKASFCGGKAKTEDKTDYSGTPFADNAISAVEDDDDLPF